MSTLRLRVAFSLAVGTFLVSFASHASAFTTTLLSSDGGFSARAAVGGLPGTAIDNTNPGVTLPFFATVSATQATSSATATISLTNSVFEVQFELLKGTGSGNFTFADVIGGILFSVDQPVDYLVPKPA